LQDLKGHSSTVWSVSFSPDGKYIVSGACDNTVKLWSLKEVNGEEMWLLEKNISNSETALLTKDAVIKNTVNLSDEYKRVFEQRKAKIEKWSLIDETIFTYASYNDDMTEYQEKLLLKLLDSKQDELIEDNHFIPSILDIELIDNKISGLSDSDPGLSDSD